MKMLVQVSAKNHPTIKLPSCLENQNGSVTGVKKDGSHYLILFGLSDTGGFVLLVEGKVTDSPLNFDRYVEPENSVVLRQNMGVGDKYSYEFTHRLGIPSRLTLEIVEG